MRAYAWIGLGAALAACATANVDSPPEPSASPLTDAELVLVGGRICSQGARTTEVPLDSASELGFRPADVLAFAAGTHATSAHWASGLVPESGAHALQVAVTPRGAHARVIAPELSVIGHGLVCETWLEIDVTVTLQSDRGALNDRFDATLYTQSADVAYLNVSAPGRKLGGALELEADASSTQHVFDLQLRASKAGISGVLSSVSQPSSDDFHPPPSVTRELAYFGPARCNIGAQPLALDTPQHSVSASMLLERVAGLRQFQIKWSDERVTQASLTFAASDGACAFEQEPSLGVAGQLRLRSQDGRLLGDYDASLSASLTDPSAGVPLAFLVDRVPQPRGESITPEQIGFPTHDRSGLEALDLIMSLAVDPQDNLSGRIELVGYKREVCADASACATAPVTLELGIVQ